MSVIVSIPTILRPHTGGEKRVSAEGATLAAVITDLEANYSASPSGGFGQPASCIASSTSMSTTRTCGSPAAWTPRSPTVTR